MSTVLTIKELKVALANKEPRIVIRGKLAKQLKPLTKLNKQSASNIPTSQGALVASFTLSGIGTAVAITLIVTIGIVSIVAMLKNYNMVLRSGDSELVLEKK
ncbi:hypothetical protein ACWS7L_02285 [Exiguobacterium artemiae]